MRDLDDSKMASGIGKHKLLVIGPTEPWSVREKLCLATSVMKSGDQNWVSVSRAIKPFAEPGRPPDWFSQKHCASKYSEFLETTEAPKRKRGEKGEIVETVEDVIVRRLTAERIDELKRLIKETQEKHRKLKKEAQLIQAGHLDSKLEDLWEDIQQKKKEEEEAAELKRKATDSAYQARLTLKLAPKRMPGVAMNSPTGCGSPNQDLSPSDPLECLTSEMASPKSALGSAQLISLAPSGPDDGSHISVLDEASQKKLLNQKATPPPSPLLSELLKKGSILPTNSRLIGDGDLPAIHMVEAGTPPGLPVPQVPGAPMLSRLLEAGPAQFSAPLGFMVSGDAALSTPATEETDAPACAEQNARSSVSSGCTGVSREEKEAVLTEDDVNVGYMGDELDLKTVGDIIAIIEDKADESAEALDAAAVEAALSLCEETGHALATAWDSGPFQPHQNTPTVAPRAPQCPPHQSSLVAKSKVLQVQGGPPAERRNSRDNCSGELPMGLRGLSPTSKCNSALEDCHPSAPPRPGTVRHNAVEVQQTNQYSTNITIKCENDKWTQHHRLDKTHRDSVLEDSPLTESHLKETKAKTEPATDTTQASGQSDLDGAEDCGVKVEEESFLSELDGDMELEPAASESEDGYSLHTASSSLHLNTTADSIPSSPASSQFSMCSEDQEALQAHKIWKKAIMLVWRAAANHRYANVFLQPVTDEIAPGYHSIVHRPMDLATIKKNIETGLIRTTAEFQRDIMLMFQNAVMYNSLDHDVYHMALEMQRDVLEQVQQFLATQLIMETTESGISAKSLRGRESTRKQDTTDKDTVSMSSPAFLLSLFDGGTRGRRCAMEADLKMKK